MTELAISIIDSYAIINSPVAKYDDEVIPSPKPNKNCGVVDNYYPRQIRKLNLDWFRIQQYQFLCHFQENLLRSFKISKI